MAGQTSVALDPDVAIEGMVSRFHNVQTHDRIAEVGLDNGRLVVAGANENKCKLPTSAAEVAKAVGIAPYRATQMPGWPPGGTATHYQAGETIGAIAQGRVWVKVEEAVADQDPVYVRFADGSGGTAKGAFRKSADTNTAAQLAGAKYITAASGGGLALVDINIP